MWLSYLIALIPILIGAILWVKSRRIVWWEWGLSSIIGFLLVLIFNACVVAGMTNDIEMWSGQVVKVEHEPRWIEEYEEAVYRTEYYKDANGNTCSRQVFSHYETRHRSHGPDWTAYANFGEHDETYWISEEKYNQLKQRFGEEKSCSGYRPGFDGGDRNDYYLVNKNRWIEPTSCIMTFENRVKAAPSVFSFVDVKDGTKGIFEWTDTMATRSSFGSNRLLGLAGVHIDRLLFDQMNSRLGPTKKVNVVMIGWENTYDSIISKLQEVRWIGGKKNDLVLCYGWDGTKTTWSYVFGWTEKSLVKRNLETILLENKVDNNILPLIEKEIVQNYELKDWDKFSYITVEPPGWTYIILLLVMGIVQTVIWIFFMNNEVDKEN